MEESNYIDMANNLNNYLEKYCGITKDEGQKVDSVEDVLTQLIHMDEDKKKQEGGIIIDDIVENLTGGNNVKNSDNTNKKTKQKDIIQITPKELDANLLEGGGKTQESTEQTDNKEYNSNSDYSEEESKQINKEDNKHDDNKTQEKPTTEPTDIKDNKPKDSEEESSDSDYSEEEEYSDISGGCNEDITLYQQNQKDMFSLFLKHYQDKECNYSISGGNSDKINNNKIQIIPMFPYLLRY